MTDLGHRLGLSKDLQFYDIYSLDDPDLLGFIPRPVHALLAIIPLTGAWAKARKEEDDQMEWYEGSGADPVLWFRQTIIHGCGLIGLIHCACNGVSSERITPGSELDRLLQQASPLKMDGRAKLLEDSDTIYQASQAAGVKGDTVPPTLDASTKMGQHFVAFVKGRDGHLWELEGSRKRPLDRGVLTQDEDLLSERALELGLKRLIEVQSSSEGDLRFSCIALAPSSE